MPALTASYSLEGSVTSLGSAPWRSSGNGSLEKETEGA